MEQVRIISKEFVTPDVVHLRTEKPDGFSFKPGQAVDVELNKPDWKNELRPFTFTSLPGDHFLEFHIKTYPDHNGVTEQIGKLNRGDDLMVGDVFGAIQYKGKGGFVAGGAGITPFIAIFKDLEENNDLKGNKLIFANKTHADIIEESYFEEILGENFINVLSKEKKEGFLNGYITKELLKSEIDLERDYVYLCGPPPMMEAVQKQLKDLGFPDSRLVQEEF